VHRAHVVFETPPSKRSRVGNKGWPSGSSQMTAVELKASPEDQQKVRKLIEVKGTQCFGAKFDVDFFIDQYPSL
jgi:hypothetical protein